MALDIFFYIIYIIYVIKIIRLFNYKTFFANIWFTFIKTRLVRFQKCCVDSDGARFDFLTVVFFLFLFKWNFRFFSFCFRLLIKTSTFSFSNQNKEPETHCFVFGFEKTKRQNVVFPSFSKTLPNKMDFFRTFFCLVHFFYLKTSFINIISSLTKNTKNNVLLKIFVSFRFWKQLLKTTSTVSFSNQNDEPETCRFACRFEKTKTKRQNGSFAVVFKNGTHHYV